MNKTSRTIHIMIGLTILAVILVFLYMAWSKPVVHDGKVQLKPMDLPRLHQDWIDEVASQTRSLRPDADAAQIKGVIDSLLALRVASEDRDTHLKLVLALLALERREPDAWSRVQTILAGLPLANRY